MPPVVEFRLEQILGVILHPYFIVIPCRLRSHDHRAVNGDLITPRKIHPHLVQLALAVGGFAIGTTEFATMSLLRYFAHDLACG
jgi:hypothetical protein